MRASQVIMASMFLAATNLVSAEEIKEFQYQGNPLVRHVYTADPTARVFNDRLYVYTSHDRDDARDYNMVDWRLLSTDDMLNWRDHGSFFGLDDIAWADRKAWAPDCVEKGGKYYFYYPVEQAKIGVAVSDNPEAGFKDSGKPLIDKNIMGEQVAGREPIDPTVIVHKGQGYLFFGCRDFRYVKLKSNMTEIKGDVKCVKLVGNVGNKQNYDGFYGEAPFIFEREGLFYMIYSNGWGTTSELVYATADHPEGVFTYKGKVLPHTGTATTHGSVVEYKGGWYLFYHTDDLTGSGHRRSIAYDPISFDENGNIIPVEITRTNYLKGKKIK